MAAVRLTLLALPLALLLVPTANAEPVEVEAGILLINFGNYDFAKGTYQMDFYLWMRWNATNAPANFTPQGFEFMNGRASSHEALAESEVDGKREIFYRIQANLYAEPYFKQYPYDAQRLVILIEDTVHTSDELLYVALTNESGLDENVRVAGWRIERHQFFQSDKHYSFDESYSRLEFEVHIQREPLSTSLKTFLPPLAFMIVSGLSFFFGRGKSAQRVGLGTGTLISAVMFHVSQTVSLPPIATLMLFDKIMISVYAFLATSLVVTAVIVLDEERHKDNPQTERINRLGLGATILAPIVTFLVLLAF